MFCLCISLLLLVLDWLFWLLCLFEFCFITCSVVVLLTCGLWLLVGADMFALAL